MNGSEIEAMVDGCGCGCCGPQADLRWCENCRREFQRPQGPPAEAWMYSACSPDCHRQALRRRRENEIPKRRAAVDSRLAAGRTLCLGLPGGCLSPPLLATAHCYHHTADPVVLDAYRIGKALGEMAVSDELWPSTPYASHPRSDVIDAYRRRRVLTVQARQVAAP